MDFLKLFNYMSSAKNLIQIWYWYIKSKWTEKDIPCKHNKRKVGVTVLTIILIIY